MLGAGLVSVLYAATDTAALDATLGTWQAAVVTAAGYIAMYCAIIGRLVRLGARFVTAKARKLHSDKVPTHNHASSHMVPLATFVVANKCCLPLLPLLPLPSLSYQLHALHEKQWDIDQRTLRAPYSTTSTTSVPPPVATTPAAAAAAAAGAGAAGGASGGGGGGTGAGDNHSPVQLEFVPELHVPTAVTLCTRRAVVHGVTFTVAAMSVAVLALAGVAGASPSGVATGSVVITWLLRLAAVVGVIMLHSRFRVS